MSRAQLRALTKPLLQSLNRSTLLVRFGRVLQWPKDIPPTCGDTTFHLDQPAPHNSAAIRQEEKCHDLIEQTPDELGRLRPS
jgi:hypothetical protein